MVNKLKSEIGIAIVNSMKEKNSILVVTYRNIMSKIIEAEKNNNNKEISDDEIIKLIEKLAKQREESILYFEKDNRQDLIDIERLELEILKKYLPQKMDESATREAIIKAISEGANNIGLLMKELNQYGNLIDKKLASQIAKELI